MANKKCQICKRKGLRCRFTKIENTSLEVRMLFGLKRGMFGEICHLCKELQDDERQLVVPLRGRAKPKPKYLTRSEWKKLVATELPRAGLFPKRRAPVELIDDDDQLCCVQEFKQEPMVNDESEVSNTSQEIEEPDDISMSGCSVDTQTDNEPESLHPGTSIFRSHFIQLLPVMIKAVNEINRILKINCNPHVIE